MRKDVRKEVGALKRKARERNEGSEGRCERRGVIAGHSQKRRS